jgi:biopolymer transport protein ExbD
MGLSVQGSGRGRRNGHALAEINIVPLVDVVLVLLVIFMLTAHVMEFGLEVEVPKVKAVRNSADELPVVTLTKSGELFLGDKQANVNSLAAEVRRRFPSAKDAYLRADGGITWDTMAQVVAALGESKIGVRLVTQPDDGGLGRRKQ